MEDIKEEYKDAIRSSPMIAATLVAPHITRHLSRVALNKHKCGCHQPPINAVQCKMIMIYRRYFYQEFETIRVKHKKISKGEEESLSYRVVTSRVPADVAIVHFNLAAGNLPARYLSRLKWPLEQVGRV